MSVSIRKQVRTSMPRIPFEELATYALGRSYELSLVLCGDSLAQGLNKRYRKKAYRPNVLSFCIDKNEGEIFLNVRAAEREARKYGTALRKRVALLFIHGCYHLKGLRHGRRMEMTERVALGRFGLAS